MIRLRFSQPNACPTGYKPPPPMMSQIFHLISILHRRRITGKQSVGLMRAEHLSVAPDAAVSVRDADKEASLHCNAMLNWL